MNKRLLSVISTMMLAGLVLGACSPKEKETASSSNTTTSTQESSKTTENQSLSNGAEVSKILSSTDWQGTIVYDADKNDLTEENKGFIGLAKYDEDTGFYEFFDKETGETRDDEGTFFVTADGTKRILISQTNNYQAIVDLTEVNEDIFTYKRMGKDKEGNDVEVFVEHVPYSEKTLAFTNGRGELNAETGTIEKMIPGNTILAEKLWNGTLVVDAEGNDLTEENQMFISLTKFEEQTNQYEFFDLRTGESRGDFGYFDVIANNKMRAHVSIGENKYGAALEITELNDKKFTYQRVGKDKEGNDIEVFVEHEPYTGEFTPEFTF